MNKKWWKEAVVYQIYPRSFMDTDHDGIGDLKGIISKLDYLKDLGIDVIWLCPIYDSPLIDGGYDIRDYTKILKDFGTMADFDLLLSEAHKRSIHIIMDLVVNHTSDEHEWFKQSRIGNNKYKDYYHWRDEPNNWGSWFSGSAWEKDDLRNQYYLHIFAKKQPDLNWDKKEVREDVYKMMTFYLDKGVDGFRMDVISLISKDTHYPDGIVYNGLYGDLSPYCSDGKMVHTYLKEMYDKVLSHYDIMTVGEAPGLPVYKALDYVKEDRHELNMVFTFDHVNIDYDRFGKWTDRRFSLRDLKHVLKSWHDGMANGGWNSLYWDNHDQPRVVSRFGNDQEYREKSAKMLALCLHMMQGTPYIYQGEELGMTNVSFDDINDYKDIETLNAYKEYVLETHQMTHEEMMKGVHAKGRDNARTPMQWDNSKYGGFSDVQPWINVNPNYKYINAKDQIHDPNSVYSFYKELICLRKNYPIIVYGDMVYLDLDDTSLFAYSRHLDDQELVVVCNFNEQKISYPKEWVTDMNILISNDEVILGELSPYQGVAFIKAA